MSTDVRVVLVTAPQDEAPTLARTLLEERWVACVNLLPSAHSLYRWEGRVEEAQETLMVLKTIRERVEGLRDRVQALHSYDVPEFLVLNVEQGLPGYLDWVVTETALER